MIRKDRKSKLRTNAYRHSPIARALASTIALIAILTAGACSPSTIAQAQEGPTATVHAGDTAEPSVVTPAPPVSGATGTTETTVETGPTQHVAGERTSELIPAGDTFDTYANHALGFSILVPREMVITFGDCTWNEANGDHSYRPAAAPVPTAIFEEGDTVILTFASYHALTGQSLERQEDGGTRSFYANCVPMTNTLALATDTDPDNPYRAAWSIRVVDIEGQEELESFVKTRYGRGCSVGEMAPSPADPRLVDVTLDGDGKDLESTECPVNYRTVLKYDRLRGKLAVWDMGQAYTFVGAVDYTIVYDDTMIESFRFID